MHRQAHLEAGLLKLQNEFGVVHVVLRAKGNHGEQIWEIASFGRVGSPAAFFS